MKSKANRVNRFTFTGLTNLNSLSVAAEGNNITAKVAAVMARLRGLAKRKKTAMLLGNIITSKLLKLYKSILSKAFSNGFRKY